MPHKKHSKIKKKITKFNEVLNTSTTCLNYHNLKGKKINRFERRKRNQWTNLQEFIVIVQSMRCVSGSVKRLFKTYRVQIQGMSCKHANVSFEDLIKTFTLQDGECKYAKPYNILQMLT